MLGKVVCTVPGTSVRISCCSYLQACLVMVVDKCFDLNKTSDCLLGRILWLLRMLGTIILTREWRLGKSELREFPVRILVLG